MLKCLSLLSCILVLCFSSELFAESVPRLPTALENAYAQTLLGRWHLDRTQLVVNRGFDDAVLQEQAVEKPKSSYAITGTIERRLVLGQRYLMVIDNIRSDVGSSKQTVLGGHIYMEYFNPDNTEKVWTLSSSGKEHLALVHLTALKNNGFCWEARSNGQTVYWEVWPVSKNQLDIKTYHLVHGKKLLVQTEVETRLANQ